MRRAPAATPRMRPEVRPRKLTRRSASPSAKVLRMMASVSRAGMKCRRDRLQRGIRKVSGQAGRTCRTRLNTTGEDASQCWRGGVVEEMGKMDEMRSQERFERDFQKGKTFKYYFQCRRADIVLGQRQSAGGFGSGGQSRGDLIQLYFADLDRGL